MSGKYRRNNKGTGKKILILIFVLISLFCIIFFAALCSRRSRVRSHGLAASSTT